MEKRKLEYKINIEYKLFYRGKIRICIIRRRDDTKWMNNTKRSIKISDYPSTLYKIIISRVDIEISIMRKQFEISLSRISIIFLCTIVSSNFQDIIELPNYTRTIECEILSQVRTSVTPDLRYDSHEKEKKRIF